MAIDLANPDPSVVREALAADPEHRARWEIQARQQRDPTSGQFVRVGDDETGAATTHGLRSRRVPKELLELQEAFYQSSLVDESEPEEHIPARRRSLLQYRAMLHRQITQLDHTFVERGAFDRHGKMRLQWLSMLSTLIARAQALDAMLGLGRQQRQLPVPSAREWVRDIASATDETEEAATCERG